MAKTKIKKPLLILILFIIAIFLESIVLPKFILPLNVPEWVNSKIENRLLVILFFLSLLFTIGKKYFYLFKIEPLKKANTYYWIITILCIGYFMIKLNSGFSSFSKFSLFPLNILNYFLLLLQVCILVPIEEEFLYRGLLILVPNKKIKYIMLMISTIIFSLFHEDPNKIIWTGLGFGILAIRFNNIWIPIIAHSLWNLFVSFFII